MTLKTTSNWRQIAKLEKIDVCSMLNGKFKLLPFVKQAWDLVFRMIPELPRKCPFPPKTYNFENRTIMSRQIVDDFKNLTSYMTLSSSNLPPNGLYRSFYRFYSNEDPVGVVVYFEIEVNARLNDDRF